VVIGDVNDETRRDADSEFRDRPQETSKSVRRNTNTFTHAHITGKHAHIQTVLDNARSHTHEHVMRPYMQILKQIHMHA